LISRVKQARVTEKMLMLVDSAIRFCLVVTTLFFVMACDGSAMKTGKVHDSGVVSQDLGARGDLAADGNAGHDEGAVDMADAVPVVPFGRDSASPDSAIVKGDAGLDGYHVPIDSATESLARDVAGDRAGAPACTGTPVLGNLPPLAQTGDYPSAVVVGDVNGDGKPDLVVLNYFYQANGPNTVSVLLGTGDGKFAAKQDYPTADTPNAAALGDLNGDGNLDIVISNSGPATVSVLLGKGGGKFAAKQDYPTGDTVNGDDPESLALGDLNGDGHLDVVTANHYSHTVSVLYGTGDGRFSGKQDFLVGETPSSVALGDLNGDGKLDIVTGNYISDTVSVLLAKGDGTFAAKVDYASGSGTLSVAVGDLNGDGKPDVVTANSESNTVSVLLGTGDGRFAANVDYPCDSPSAPGQRNSIALDDLNGDGRPDIVTASYYMNTVSVLLGLGDGTFTAMAAYPGRGHPTSVALGDLDGDGKLDLVTTSYDTNCVSLLLGMGDGTFDVGSDYPTGGHPQMLALGDLNDDGDPDIVTVNPDKNTLSVLLGTGDGRLATHVDYAIQDIPSWAALGDFNGDGKPDLVTASLPSGTVSVLLGKGNGAFATQHDYSMDQPIFSAAVGDVNGDGKLDLVTTNASSKKVSVLLGAGDGTFASKADSPAQHFGASNALGDVNGDGRLDLVVATTMAVSVLLGTGDGTFAAEASYPTGGIFDDLHTLGFPESIALGDLNGDGRLDIVAGNSSTSTVSVLLGAGDGNLAPRVDYPTGFTPVAIALGDLNGDHELDVVTLNAAGTVSLLLGKGDGAFATKVEYAAAVGTPPPGNGTGPSLGSLVLGDLNGDGRPDIVVTSTVATAASVLLNSCQ
jgi:hypothetical protein